MHIALLPTSLIVATAISVASCQTADSRQSAAAFPSFAAQAQHGADVYRRSCARCHGPSGRGDFDAPALVGPGALQGFNTALAVAEFVTANMPPEPERRRHMPERDYWAVLAFALTANGVTRRDPVGPANAAEIALQP